MNKPSRQLVSSDWHGEHWAWDKVKNFLGDNDVLYYLGDATDRGFGFNGDGGWTMLKEMLQDPRVVYLKGNHDVMLADVIFRPNSYDAVNLSWINGGEMTMNAAEVDPEAKRIAHMIQRLSTYEVYIRPDGKSVFMSHSGSTDTDDEYSLLWDRNEYITRQNWTDYDYVIHGHTRAKHIIKDLKNVNSFLTEDKKFAVPAYTGGAYWYSDWRATVDCGTVRTNQIVLMDLDTFEEHIFRKD